MALRYDFQPGPKQSLDACSYFSLLGNEMVDSYVTNMEPRQYLMGQAGYATQPVRVWSRKHTGPGRMYELLPWIRTVMKETRKMTSGKGGEDVVGTVHTWMDTQHAEDTLFIELPHPQDAFTPKEVLAHTIGIIGGETVLLSAHNLMSVKLEADLFGLALANVGSYLVERLHGSAYEHAYIRRAS
ncbi:MAG: hypothetical protein ABI599_11470 [Flavobacteriales bacterium]